VAAVGHVPLEAEEAHVLGRDQWNALRTGRDHAERRFVNGTGAIFVGLISVNHCLVRVELPLQVRPFPRSMTPSAWSTPTASPVW